MESDEKIRGRQDWIAPFDLLAFLVNSLTALSTHCGWRGDKQIAIPVNHMGIMHSVTNKR